ncbi:unnamed protein product [Larinioides sclopetarius]|uniref:E3 ubiquitin-protein ligase RNF25 n=1 Tax=Larinioides sclopetarius TaxID=280406 RepID=A0AAV1ZUU4_9ARAC
MQKFIKMADVKEKCFEMEDTASFVEQELEALQSIYLNEIEIKHDEDKSTISIDLYPATADNHDEQYVRMTLKFILNEEYPHAIPEISIRNPRGLSEEKLNSIMQDLTSIAKGKTGSSMLFEIIEAAKEHLTNENRPCGECAICLYGFSEDDVFTKTECYHYFHSHCLARYVKNAAASESNDETNHSDTPSDKKILCPMCRLPIHFEGSEELYPPPSAKDDEFVIDEEVLALQKKMSDLYQKQLNKGGIIDIEAEKNKYLLEISNVPTRVEKSSPSSTVDDTDSIPEADPSSKIVDSACGDSQSFSKNKVSGSKDLRTDFRNKDKPDGRPRNDRYGYNKHPRNNSNRSNSYRGNQRYIRYSKPNTQNFNRKSNDNFASEEFDYGDERYTDDENNLSHNKYKSAAENCSEDSHHTSPVSESSPGFRSSNSQRKSGRTDFSDSKKYINNRKGSDYRPNSNWDRRYGPNDFEKHGYRGNQRGTKSNPSKNDSPIKNGQQNEVINDDISVSDSNIREISSESVSEETVTSTLAVKQEGDKNFTKKQEDRPRYSNAQNRKNSYHNCDSDTNYLDDNAQSQEGRKDSFRRGKSGRGFRNNYNDRQSYRESNYHSQGNRYMQENSHKRNFNQQSHQGDRHSQVKNSYHYEDRRDYNKGRFNDGSTHEAPNRKLSSDDRYEYRESENNSQGNISRKPSYRSLQEDEFNDAENSYMEKGNRYNDRNRNNTHYQNRDQNSRGIRNNRYDNYSSYQNNRNANRRNAPRKYSDNSESHYYKGDERTKSESQASLESENYVNEKQPSTSMIEKVSAPKTDVSRSVACEIPFKETNVPDMKAPASDTTVDVIPQKMVRPPPGFNNPLKKVVYGLQAANPPPGFPRS